MKLLSKFKRGVQDNGGKSKVWDACNKYYDFVTVDENLDEYGRYFRYPYRVMIRTDKIANDLIFDLECLGYECKDGSSCNEWETSMQVRKNKEIEFHPPHMPMKITPPKELEIIAPTWDNFLKHVTYLGHLLGTLDNGIQVPKQAFGECDTSIVLETYKRAYGDEYKAHQCNECINFELSFKQSIENHNVRQFEDRLKAFTLHFIEIHKSLFDKLKEKNSDDKLRHAGNLRGRNKERTWLDREGGFGSRIPKGF